jgi:hypothetical protein
LFRKIALEELNWRVVDYRNRVLEKHPDAIEDEQPKSDDESSSEKSKDRS